MTFTEDIDFYIYPSMVQEFLYCKRFIYFMFCLDVPQNEHKFYKVEKAKSVHDKKKNYKYVPKGYVNKKSNETLYSKKSEIKAVIDEILFYENAKACPLDYKYAEYKGIVWDTLKYQSVIHALLIEENYNVKCEKGLICYLRSNNKIAEVIYTGEDFKNLDNIIREIMYIIDTGYFPVATEYENRCIRCTYRNICPH